jgi:hypothetical protein
MERILIVLVACGLAGAPAQAGPNRTWVSGTGTDSGACTRAAPCRTFAFALTQTNAGGEIVVLDPAGYGPLTITKAISIVNDGAGTAAIGGGSALTAVVINAGATDSVHLRGLTIEGTGGGTTNGIIFNTGGNLAIENCVVRNFLFGGIFIAPTGSSTPMSFSVSNTIASNNGLNGINVQGNGNPITGVLSRVTANNNGNIGIGVSSIAGSLNVTIVGSEASNNGGAGVNAGDAAFSNGPTAVMLRSVVASNNKTGLEADGSGVVLRVAQSVVTGNTTGVNTSGGGTIKSYGDNNIDGNSTNGSPTATIPTH